MQFVAFLQQNEGKTTLFFRDLQNNQTTNIDPGFVARLWAIQRIWSVQRRVVSFQWISDRRVIFTTVFSE